MRLDVEGMGTRGVDTMGTRAMGYGDPRRRRAPSYLHLLLPFAATSKGFRMATSCPTLALLLLLLVEVVLQDETAALALVILRSRVITSRRQVVQSRRRP